MTKVVVVVLTALTFVARPAAAQPAQRFADLALYLNLDDDVGVDAGGAPKVWGRVTRLEPDRLTVRTADGEQTFTAATAVRVQRRGDPTRNGVVRGFLFGAAAGCLFAASFAETWRFQDCPAGVLLFAPLGAGIGLGLDASIRGTTTVFAAPAGGPPPAVARAGLQLRWRW